MSNIKVNSIAIILIIASTLFGTLMVSFIKNLTNDLNTPTLGFYRFFIGLIIISPFIIHNQFKILKTPNLKLHILRSLINLPSMLMGFAALSFLTLEKASALHFVVPLFVTILAIIILKEKIYYYRTIALIFGFIGMIIVIRPGIIGIDIGSILSLGASFTWAFAIIIVKRVSKVDSSITILAYQYIFMTFLSFLVLIFYWQVPNFEQLFFLFFAAFFGTIMHLCVNQAYKMVDVTLTTPFTFLGLLWASIIGYIYFNEFPDFFTWLGGSIIFASVFLVTWREAKLNREISKKTIPVIN